MISTALRFSTSDTKFNTMKGHLFDLLWEHPELGLTGTLIHDYLAHVEVAISLDEQVHKTLGKL